MKFFVWSLHRSEALQRAVELVERYGFELEVCIGSIATCRERLEKSWSHVDVVLCVSPVALCVRMVSPFLRDKHLDPAVVTLSPLARVAIPIIGDHRGGAMICEFLSSKIGCICVETSLSCEEGTLSLDDLAFRLRLELVYGERSEFENLVKSYVYGKRISMYVDGRAKQVLRSVEDERARRLLNRVSYVRDPRDADLCIVGDPETCRDCNGCCLAMKRLAVGLGFCSIASANDIVRAMKEILDIFGSPLIRVDTVAVPSVRASHPVIEDLRGRGLRVEVVDVEKARMYGVPDPRARYGVRSLCEAVARAALGGGRTLIVKARFGRVTVSVVEKGYGYA